MSTKHNTADPTTKRPVSTAVGKNKTESYIKEKKEKEKHNLTEFELERLLGQGAFGMVYLAKHRATGKYCALKQIDKTVVKKMGKEDSVKTEKTILSKAKSPFHLKAFLAFQDHHLAWMVLEYCPGGDLQEFLMAVECLEESQAVLYFAEMITSVHDLHTLGFIHRDLKPANFLIDKFGHIKLADFGLSKHKNMVGKMQRDSESPPGITDEELQKRMHEVWRLPTSKSRVTFSNQNLNNFFFINAPNQKTKENRLSAKYKHIHKYDLRKEWGHSIVGSPEYMAPEVTSGRHQGGSYYGTEVDWWSLGCIFFEMIFGAPPFSGDSPEELFLEIDTWNQILPKLFEEHRSSLSDECYSLLNGFLNDPVQRLGKEIEVVKKHGFFKGLDWNNLLTMTPPFVPQTPPEMSFFSST